LEVGLCGCWAEALDEDCSASCGPWVWGVRRVEGHWGCVAVDGFMGVSSAVEVERWVLERWEGRDRVWWEDGKGDRIAEGWSSGCGGNSGHGLR
jgi:hypothetical protein